MGSMRDVTLWYGCTPTMDMCLRAWARSPKRRKWSNVHCFTATRRQAALSVRTRESFLEIMRTCERHPRPRLRMHSPIYMDHLATQHYVRQREMTKMQLVESRVCSIQRSLTR